MKLDRSDSPDGKGKYALIKLRDVPDSALDSPESMADAIIENPEIVDFGETDDSEFFVIRLKDAYAEPALRAYQKAAREAGDDEWSREVRRLANKAATHPNKQRPD